MRGKREKWIDISKGIAIIATVVGHVSLLEWNPWKKLIFSFHMPLFFIVAGYTTKEVFDRGVVKKCILRLLVPYLEIAVIMSLYFIAKGSNIKTELLRIFWGSGVPATYGPGIPLFGNGNIPVLGMLWFLPCLFFAKIVFQVYLALTKRLNLILRGLGIAAISGIGYLIGQKYKFPLGLDVSLFSVIFLFAGFLLKKVGGMKKKSVVLGAVLLGLWYLSMKCNAIEMSARYYREFPYCIFSALGAIAASYLIFYFSSEILERVKGVNTLLCFCGKNSLVILIIHSLESMLVDWNLVLEKLPICFETSRLARGVCIATVRTLFCIAVCAIYVMIKEKVIFGMMQKKDKRYD